MLFHGRIIVLFVKANVLGVPIFYIPVFHFLRGQFLWVRGQLTLCEEYEKYLSTGNLCVVKGWEVG